VIQTIVALAVIVLIFVVFLPKVVDYGDVWAAITDMTWLELLTLAILAVWNQATYVLVEMSARPGLTARQAFTITQTSTALSNTIPGGAALGAGLQTAMYRSYRFPLPDVALSLAVTGIWNTFVKLGMPVVALALLALAGASNEPLVAASFAGVATLVGFVLVLVVILRSERGAVAVGTRLTPVLNRLTGLARRPSRENWGRTFGNFRKRTVTLLRDRWWHLTAATLASHVTLYLLLLMTLRHMGISNGEVGWQEALAAFAFVRLLSALPITPGGLGVVELGLTAALVAAGGDDAQVVAAVLVYRVLTFVLPIPVGALTYFLWRRESRRLRANGDLTEQPERAL
jgi:uncharacterized protein (TIRG00374 family)